MRFATAIMEKLPKNIQWRPKKTIAAIIAILVLVMAVTRCGSFLNQAEANDSAKAVKVLKTIEKQNSVSLDYIGTIDAQELIKYSFKTAGQIKKIYVSEGDQVKAGEMLAELDNTDLQYQQSAAGATQSTAAADISKAKAAFDYADELYIKAQSLYEDGAISKDYLDQIELKKETAGAEYQQALSQHSEARTDYNYKTDLLNNSVIYAEQDGYVVQKISNEFERVGAYNPVLVVRSGTQIVNIGIPQQELKEISVGAIATINVDGEIAQGTITKIAEVPDEITRTYNAEITVPGKTFQLGSIAKVSVRIGSKSGIWIPMSSIFSDDGENCVYVVDNEHALKRIIEIQSIHDDQAMIAGLEKGELLVISGMSRLDDGTKIQVQSQE